MRSILLLLTILIGLCSGQSAIQTQMQLPSSMIAVRSDDGNDLLAIDILLKPDSSMSAWARSINAELRKDYPEGYALDAFHIPHITLVQRYIHRKDLPVLERAIDSAIQQNKILPIELMTTGNIWSAWGDLGIVLCGIEKKPELVKWAAVVTEIVQRIAATGGTKDAFAHQPGETMDDKTVQWVEQFVPASSGDHFFPHVTLGTAHPAFLKSFLSGAFHPLRFQSRQVAIYQLGMYGTAQKMLWSSSKE